MPAAPAPHAAVPFENQLPAVIAAAIDDAAINGQLNNFNDIANPPPANDVVNDVHPQLHMLAIEWYPESNPLQLKENGENEDASNVGSSSENVPMVGQTSASKNLKRELFEETDNSVENPPTKRLKLEEETTHQENNSSLPPPNFVENLQVDSNRIIPLPAVQEENSDDLNTT
ncbi:unnamed protein product [Meloidogyne enterolobii]|uniref:Uncharacterized protein n=1 Tax=Meloidogyne enterolobii TaxID=390850 RepID=A0ACB1ABH0_MELEN